MSYYSRNVAPFIKNPKLNGYIKKSDFLDCLDTVYENANVEYLISLRDGLSVIIRQRLNGGLKPFDKNFCGYVRYQ